jgi:uncharacterized protein YbjT (DUF2867 family)
MTGARRVLIAGASGLVGALCLRRLLAAGADEVVAVARRPLGESDRRLQVIITELDRLGIVPPSPARAALCALGTTMARAGSQQAFRAVDQDAVLAFARWARQGGATTFVLVSSVGAAAKSRSFYLRVKGETEEAIGALGFSRVVVLRPSLLVGPRAERRFGERVAQALMPALTPMLMGGLRRYRALSAADVAGAMVAAVRTSEPGTFVWHHDEILAASRSAPTG